ncbi:MAG: membrane integrity-associated transporter subunit PqiC [Pseudomonadales bacterium]|nr:membrane integrity-associated transporter subunit PqiC [Pseudomonadales bacterium]
MTRPARLGICALVPLLLLAGCLRLPARTEPIRIVAPAVAVTPAQDWPVVAWSLAVQRPIADQTRGSVRVVVRTPHSRLAFYPGIAWLDELPDMLQSILLEGFVDSGRVASVARPGTALARYQLVADIRAFDLVDAGAGLATDLVVHGSLVEVRTGRIVASRVFRTDASVSGRGVDAVTAAFEQALARLVGEVVEWTLRAPPLEPDSAPDDPPEGAPAGG